MARIELGLSCGEDWDGMTPTEGGARRCGACGEDVVDLSRLTRKEAARIVGRSRPPCVSFETDASGDVVFRTERARASGLLAIASELVSALRRKGPRSRRERRQCDRGVYRSAANWSGCRGVIRNVCR